MNSKHFISKHLDDLKDISSYIASNVKKGDIVSFQGEMGSGKTTLIKAIASSICDIPQNLITSPTFSYMNIYEGLVTVYHFDLYRLKSEKEFLEIGLGDYLYENGICLIEWSEKIINLLPKKTKTIKISHLSIDKRLIECNL